MDWKSTDELPIGSEYVGKSFDMIVVSNDNGRYSVLEDRYEVVDPTQYHDPTCGKWKPSGNSKGVFMRSSKDNVIGFLFKDELIKDCLTKIYGRR